MAHWMNFGFRPVELWLHPGEASLFFPDLRSMSEHFNRQCADITVSTWKHWVCDVDVVRVRSPWFDASQSFHVRDYMVDAHYAFRAIARIVNRAIACTCVLRALAAIRSTAPLPCDAAVF